MENKYEITEKQLAFLEDYLKRKYPNFQDEVRIELIDHLISDFEATTQNGNLSQYLSNELGFIRRFANRRVSEFKKTYGKQTWNHFFDFFTDLKLLPISIAVFSMFYFLAEKLNNKWLWGTFLILQSVILLLSAFFGMINKKKLSKVDEVKYLGAEIWLPFLMIHLADGFEFKYFLMSNSYLFTIYASFAIIYGLAAFIVLRKQRKIILEKYKHLLN
ncbi:hypothetical protein LPB136_11555 [Tenacibaculum todarodis]|uniref:Uncharacterized protein n=1 Tax=Tenacibaculum todarodis TaxID=1850252 RepID=A0A1L3JLI4_9FLAO|nr:hypothetical protein [Tenacibaculum todarodis]APG65959.1 hypothetical protein LPB136_11555 [Tenacibaculum todarodis]